MSLGIWLTVPRIIIDYGKVQIRRSVSAYLQRYLPLRSIMVY
jgi:hypothetical protein